MSNINLYNGDCTEIMKELPDKSVDCIITDQNYLVKGFSEKIVEILFSLWYNRFIR